MIIVAHRPSALAAIDTLLMMKDGQQVAFGPKEEVLAKVLQNARPPGDGRPGPVGVPARVGTAPAAPAPRKRNAEPDSRAKGLQTNNSLTIVSDTDKEP